MTDIQNFIRKLQQRLQILKNDVRYSLSLLPSTSHRVFLPLFFRSRSQYVQVIGRTSSALSSCPTPTIRRSCPALETASSTTQTQRRVLSTTDSVSSPAIMGQLMRYWTQETLVKHLTEQTYLSSSWFPSPNLLPFCFVRLWRYQMTPTRFCRVERTARCDGLTSARRRAALKKTAKMYGDSFDVFSSQLFYHALTLRVGGAVSVGVFGPNSSVEVPENVLVTFKITVYFICKAWTLLLVHLSVFSSFFVHYEQLLHVFMAHGF